MNFKIPRVAKATIAAAMIMIAPCMLNAQGVLVSSVNGPRVFKKTSKEINSEIDAGRVVKTKVIMNANDTKLYITDVIKNKVLFNGYKSKTWFYLKDVNGNIIKEFTITNWAEGTLMPGPSTRTVRKVIILSPEEAAKAFDIEIMHTQRGGTAPNLLKKANKIKKQINELQS